MERSGRADAPGCEFHEPRFGRAGKFQRAAAPVEPERAGMERVVRQYQSGALRLAEAALHEGEITILVAAVKLVADEGMAEVGEMEAELVLAAGAGKDAQERAG